MDDSPLRRLLEHRGVPATGDPRDLAPLLGWHAADLFVLAGRDVPVDLAAAPGRSSGGVGSIVGRAAEMTPAERRHLQAVIRRMPEVKPSEPMPAVSEAGPGPILGALVKNRAMRRVRAGTLMVIGEGPYVSDSTVAMLFAGRVELTPRYVSAFAYLLGVPVADLAAVTGVDGHPEAQPHPDHEGLAELAWDARRLTAEQIKEVRREASSASSSDPRRYCRRCGTRHWTGEHGYALGTGVDTLPELERRLDVLLLALGPAGSPPPDPAGLDEGTALVRRVDRKRREAAGRIDEQPDLAARLGPEILDVILHDGAFGKVGRFVRAAGRALGDRTLAERLLAAAETGSLRERSCAGHSWAWMPSMHDATTADLRARFEAASRASRDYDYD
ncbi:hypothetical protein AB0M02_35170 [Actinoplanes sp. NPDC051861]|uniref:hypothetical protein n=1 Tax=Actinoplanes sp. NPDC051861 TaxID=3155170 RepID=UPI0034307005